MGSQPAAPPCPSILLPPALLSLPWLIPFRPSSPPSHPPAPRLCVALAQRGRRRHTDGHADGQRGNAGLPPHTCSLLAQGLGQAATQHTHTHTHTHTNTHTHRCASNTELSLSIYWTSFPHIDTQTGAARADPPTRRSTCWCTRTCFNKRPAFSLLHAAAQPVSHRCLHALSPTAPQHVLSTNLFCTYTPS